MAREATSTASRPRILLADDHAIVAEALRLLLSDQYEVVGVAGDGRVLVSKAHELKPDLVVADIGMPALNGLDAAEQLKFTMPNVRFVFLTMMDDPELATAALRMAPVGFVLKHSAADELLKAIDDVLHGRTYVTPRIKRQTEAVADRQPRGEATKLTPRQRDVLQQFAKGHSTKEIADILQISERTVEFHKYHVMNEFNAHSPAALVLLALKNGLISR
ncbi:MAG TPA: response regulator transcription factor [Candidatus Angelobacter sp.]|nr:response regulator transcription factor [Candidatus Angelobacter sp.]